MAVKVCAAIFDVLNFLKTAVSFGMLVVLASPIAFETTYSRHPSVGNVTHPMFNMSITIGNYICSTPRPNFQVSSDQLNEFWDLPQYTALSVPMEEIGRCHMASDYLRKRGVIFDANKCNCVDGSWPIVVMILAMFSIFEYLIVCMIRKDVREQLQAKCFYQWSTTAWLGAWMSMMAWLAYRLTPAIYAGNQELQYTLDNSMQLQNYYRAYPNTWFVAYVLCGVNVVINLSQKVAAYVYDS